MGAEYEAASVLIMRLTKSHWMGIVLGVILLTIDVVFFKDEAIFLFLVGISAMVIILPFLVGLIIEGRTEREKNERFLEFTRSLAESVKTGTPVGKSILNMSTKDFGSLSPHIRKLANQISLGIPISKALETFASEVDSVVVRRAVTLIREAENAGGEIDFILDSTAASIYEIEKLKRERKAAISSLVVQGYIIFFIFIGIMLIMQFKILPLTKDISSVSSYSAGSGGLGEAGVPGFGSTTNSIDALTRPFLYLLLIQGLFAGLTIGKLSEGSIKAGIKHSIVLTLVAFIISSGAPLVISV